MITYKLVIENNMYSVFGIKKDGKNYPCILGANENSFIKWLRCVQEDIKMLEKLKDNQAFPLEKGQ